MFYLSNRESLLDETESHEGLNVHNSRNPFSSYHEIDFPVYISSVTCNPDSKDSPYIWCCFAPDFYNYAVFTSEDLKALEDHSHFHHHNCYEGFWVLKGNMYQKIEGEDYFYQTGSGGFLNRNIRHGERINKSFQLILLGISTNFAQELLSTPSNGLFQAEKNYKRNTILSFLKENNRIQNARQQDYLDFIPVLTGEHHVRQLHDLFDRLIHIFLSPDISSTLQLKTVVYELFDLLGDEEKYHSAHIQLGANSEMLLFYRISSLMQESHGRIKRKDLSNQLNYNGNDLNRIVKKYTGMSLFDYGMEFCLQDAAQMLSKTNMTISEICQELKFTNRTHFYKLFEEKYKMTPKAYRAQQKPFYF